MLKFNTWSIPMTVIAILITRDYNMTKIFDFNFYFIFLDVNMEVGYCTYIAYEGICL